MDQSQGTASGSFQPGSAVSFRAAISSRQSYADGGTLATGMLIAPSGNAPSPFDALDGPRLAGPQGSHPLANVDPRQLLAPTTGGLEGGSQLRASSVMAGSVAIGVRRGLTPECAPSGP